MWTPAELLSEARAWRGVPWRLVEMQSRAVTMALTGSLEDQRILEEILEETKPAYPPGTEHLHFLLKTPFRYQPHSRGSRFRKPHVSHGVFYAARAEETSVAESAFWALLFFLDSPSTPYPRHGIERTGFQARAAAERTIDLAEPPFAMEERLRAPADYSFCQAFAAAAREAGVQAIEYPSVRDPDGGANIALLTPDCFADPEPVPTSFRTWRFFFGADEIRAVREFPHETIAFQYAEWSHDPRIAAMPGARSPKCEPENGL